VAVASTGGSAIAEPTGSAAADLSYVKAQIKAASKVPTFKAPGPAFNAKAAKGKTIFVIPELSSVPFLNAIDSSIQSIGKKYGVNVTVYPNQGQTSQWVQGMNQAISEKAAAIILGAPPAELGPQIKQAKAAGIPVEVLHLYDQKMPVPSGVTSTVFAPFTSSAKLMADWTIDDTAGKADAVIISSDDTPPSKYMVTAMLSEFKKYCPSCKTTVVDVPSSDWGTKLQAAVQSALIADPNVNYVIPLFDSASQFVIPAITAAGRTGKVKITSYNGTPFVLKDLAQKNSVAMDVGESQEWIAYANMDEVLREITGHKPLKGEMTPTRVFDLSNIHVAGNPPDPNKAFGKSYIAGYTALWSGK
jgi:ribose transport system substrate-binding protein